MEHLPERLSGSTTAVQPPCHSLRNSFDLPWRHQPPGLSSPPGGAACPGTGAVALAMPRCSRSCCPVRLKLSVEQLRVPESWVKYLKTLKRRRSYSIFISSLFPLVMLLTKLIWRCFCLFLSITISPGNQLCLYLVAKTSHLESKAPVVVFILNVRECAGSQSKSWNPYSGFI